MGPRRKPEGYHLPKWLVVAGASAPFLTLLLGPVLRSMNLATVPYVDSRHDEAIRYADKLGIDILGKAYEHSDHNLDKMNGRMDTLNGKLDVLIDRKEHTK